MTDRDFGTGAYRESAEGKGRFDLVPLFAVRAIASAMERGQRKYGNARNWESGIPLSCFFDSAMRHLAKAGAGFDDEDHFGAALWNIACLVETRERIERGILPAELADLPDTYAGQKPGF